MRRNHALRLCRRSEWGLWSGNGIGNHSNQLVSGSSAGTFTRPDSEYRLQVGQTVTVTMANSKVFHRDASMTPRRTGSPGGLISIIRITR